MDLLNYDDWSSLLGLKSRLSSMLIINAGEVIEEIRFCKVAFR